MYKINNKFKIRKFKIANKFNQFIMKIFKPVNV